MSKERKPDLASDDYRELEARVDRLMTNKKPKNAQRKSADANESIIMPDKPDLPMDDEKLDIKVVRDETEDTPEDVSDDLKSFLQENKDSLKQEEAVQKKEEVSGPADPAEDPVIESPETDQAVKAIVASEGDTLLDSNKAEEPAKNPSLLNRFRSGWVAWWRNPKKRNATIAALVIAVTIAMIVPVSRYAILNLLGVRSSTSLTVVDNSSLQPLRNVEVRVGDQTAYTNEDGYARLEKLKLGKHDLHIERRAFATRSIGVTLGWGSNPLGEHWLYPTGAQYVFAIDDYVSGEPIHRAEAISDDASAYADENGLVRLTLDIPVDAEEVEVEIAANGYRTDVFTISAEEQQQQSVRLVPELSHFFVSKQSGELDVYRVDVDGENEEVVLPATGSERDDMILLPHPTLNRLAVVSTRNDKRNDDGFLLSSLTIVDVNDEQVVSVAESERIQPIGWFDDRLVFVRIAAGASGTNPGRHRLMSYDYGTNRETELARSNYFNAIATANDYVYYAPSSIFQTESTSLYRIRADGAERGTALERESWSLYRKSYDTLIIATSDRWYEYDIFSGDTERLDGQPSNLSSRLYIENPWSEQENAWIDQRDGQGVLFVYDSEEKEEAEMIDASGLRYPLRWLNQTTLVYRINTETEVADYAISTSGGDPVKIRNVTPVSSTERWFSF